MPLHIIIIITAMIIKYCNLLLCENAAHNFLNAFIFSHLHTSRASLITFVNATFKIFGKMQFLTQFLCFCISEDI